jgi:hypothetical protein
VNEDPANAPTPPPHWSHAIVVFHPLVIRLLLATSLWFGAHSLTDTYHWCGLGYKTAERLAPFVVPTLAALCVLCVPRYRFGLPLAIAVVALYLFALYPAYLHWIHGPGRHHFPDADSEVPDFPEKQPTAVQ